jgi:NitT/TauT family transport system substrate-binding protein
VTAARRVGWRRPALAALALCLAAVTAACGGDGSAAGPDSPAPGRTGPRVPDAIAAGCGAQAVTPPADLDVARVVARCGPGAPAAAPLAAPVTLRVAVPPDVGPEQAPILVADARGEFAAENLAVELVELGPSEAMAGLLAGDVDLVAGNVAGAYYDALHAGARVRLVLGGVLSRAPNDPSVGQTGLWVRNEALPTGALKDLRLQPVAVPGGMRTAVTYPVGLTFGQTEITLNDVAVTDDGGGRAAAALLDGEVAAAWLDGGAWLPLAGDERFRLAATLPSSESIDGTIAGERLLGSDRDAGVAYVRAIIRTINTYLSDDYRSDEDTIAAIAAATAIDPGVLAGLPPLLFDWEVRAGTAGRVEDGLRALGGVTYDIPLDPLLLVDRALVADALGTAHPPPGP